MIKDNIILFKERILSLCNKLGRDVREITIIGVTKYSQIEDVRTAIESGIDHIGENRVQDVQKKFEQLSLEGLRFKRHMIGHLQSNKVKKSLEFFDLIQSVDSYKLAQEISKYSRNLNKITEVLIQINTSGELQKFGIEKSKGLLLIEQISELENIQIQGLMTIAPFTDDREIIRNCFRDLRIIRDKVDEFLSSKPNVEMKYLSMGMTDDFELALEEGSNMVRIGRAIFK